MAINITKALLHGGFSYLSTSEKEYLGSPAREKRFRHSGLVILSRFLKDALHYQRSFLKWDAKK